MALTGREVQLEAYPQEEVRTDDFSIVEVPVRDLDSGEILVRNTWTSVDPGLRLRLTETGPISGRCQRLMAASPPGWGRPCRAAP